MSLFPLPATVFIHICEYDNLQHSTITLRFRDIYPRPAGTILQSVFGSARKHFQTNTVDIYHQRKPLLTAITCETTILNWKPRQTIPITARCMLTIFCRLTACQAAFSSFHCRYRLIPLSHDWQSFPTSIRVFRGSGYFQFALYLPPGSAITHTLCSDSTLYPIHVPLRLLLFFLKLTDLCCAHQMQSTVTLLNLVHYLPFTDLKRFLCFKSHRVILRTISSLWK